MAKRTLNTSDMKDNKRQKIPLNMDEIDFDNAVPDKWNTDGKLNIFLKDRIENGVIINGKTYNISAENADNGEIQFVINTEHGDVSIKLYITMLLKILRVGINVGDTSFDIYDNFLFWLQKSEMDKMTSFNMDKYARDESMRQRLFDAIN